MKTNTLLLSILLLFTAQLYAQQAKKLNTIFSSHNSGKYFAKAATQELPQTTLRYFWDDQTNEWEDPTTVKTIYNSAGKPTTETNINYFNGGADSSVNVQTYTYNSNNQVILNYSIYWNSFNQIWDTIGKHMSTYDMHGTEILNESYYKNNGMWIVSGKNKVIPTYDVNHRISEEISQIWIDSLNDFVNEGKGIYTYNGQGEVSGLTQMEWDTTTSTFINAGRITNVVWYKYAANFDEALIGSYLMQEWDGANYVDASRESYIYDTHDNETSSKSEIWNMTEWVIDWQNKNILTYNNNQLTQRIGQNWDNADTVFVNSSKEVFSDFISFTGIEKQTAITQLGVNIYPNPFSNTSTISINQFAPNSEFKLYDMLGHEVYTTTIEMPNTTIEKGDLQKGIYIYQVLNHNKSVAKGKLIIE